MLTKRKPLTDLTSDSELANQFTDYFLGKMVKIRKAVQDKGLYTPYDQVVNILDQFTSVSKDYIMKKIMSMPTKSCELDALPTKILKSALHKYVTITKISSLSLSKGVFVDKWKTAMVRPLLKKTGLALSPIQLPTSEQPQLSFKTDGEGCLGTISEPL